MTFSGRLKVRGALVLGFFFLLNTNLRADEAAIELVPTFVWQGTPVGSHQIQSVKSISEKLEGLRIVHMISPVYLMRSYQESEQLRGSFAELLKPKDVVGMHVAPYKDWAIFSKSKPGIGRGIYGRSRDLCDSVCGLESEVSGVSHIDFKNMILSARQEFRRNGFGDPRIAMFEEGLVANDIWQIALENGLSEDWSGFNIDTSRQLLERYPFFTLTERLSSEFLLANVAGGFHKGRSLDHMRFGVLADATSLEQLVNLAKKAVEFAKSERRSVLIPLIVSVGSSVHVQNWISEGVGSIRKIASASGIEVGPWSGDFDGGWSREGLSRKLNIDLGKKIATPVASMDQLSDEKLFDRAAIKEVTPIEIVPASQKIINSNALQLSH